jgi:hypothetical protein
MRQWLINTVPDALHPLMRLAEHQAISVMGKIYRAIPVAGNRPSGYVLKLKDCSEYREIYPPDEWNSPSAGIGSLQDGRVYTSMGTIITKENQVVFDVSYPSGSPESHPIFAYRDLGKISRIDERVAVLSYKVQKNYYDWMLGVLPRLHLLRKSGVQYDRITVAQDHRFQRDTLRYLQVDPKILVTDNSYVEAKELIVPVLTALNKLGNQPMWALKFLRDSFLPLATDSRSSAKVYISRSTARYRRINNEIELLRVLEKFGFETYFPEQMSIPDQISLFNNADCVISAHGAALANLVFCKPKTKVIEIYNPNYPVDYYKTLSTKLGLHHYSFFGKGKQRKHHRIYEDIEIDIGAISKLVADLL